VLARAIAQSAREQDMPSGGAGFVSYYRFVYAAGGGHCDDNARHQVMPDGLIWLWRGYQTPK
jgi:hypothetical protein